MFGFGSPIEIAVILGVVVLLFGTKKLPELGAGLGKAISNFRNSYKDENALDVTPIKEEPKDNLKKTTTKEQEELNKAS
ncbi:UNVERIFIED_CONTAM: hypothetical protein GTU68_051320 [Idotea baltica]|nr:hypothetical protein [Idotea baltica]